MAPWSHDYDTPPPAGTGQHHQKVYDTRRVMPIVNKLSEDAQVESSYAWHLAASTHESGVWLIAP